MMLEYQDSSLRNAKNPVNPLCAKFFRRNKKIYFHFISFLHINMPQVVEILPHERQGPT